MIDARASFIRVLDELALDAPDQVAVGFHCSGESSTWTRGELAGTTTALAEELIGAAGGRGRPVAIVSPSVEHQAVAFLAAARAGLYPTILSHPSVKQATARYTATIPPMLKATGIELVMTTSEMADLLEDALTGQNVRLIHLPSSLRRAPWSGPAENPPDVRFLQYSSGTTGIRKGVAIDERRLMSNLAALARATQHAGEDVTVSWLPLYHDMGLVAAFLLPLVAGSSSIHLSPFEWLQRPSLLLHLLSSHQGTISFLPNFAFSLLASRIKDEELQGVQLDSVRILVSGGEPARAEAFESFAKRYERRGLRKDVFRVGYGMAECVAAVTVSGSRLRADSIDAASLRRSNRAVAPADAGASMTVLSCGRPVEGASVRIAGTSSDRVAGEIEVHSESLFDGYVGGSGIDPFTSDGWYRTGDHGYLADGELFVLGRLSDIVIVRGENIYPADVESVIEALPGVKPGRCVVFGLYDESAGTEALIVAVEPTDPDHAEELREAVVEEVHSRLGIMVSDVFLAASGALIKSTSGKLSRRRNRELYLAEGRRLEPTEVDDEALRTCTDIVRRLTRVDHVGPQDHLVMSLGCDSLTIVRIAEALSRHGRDGITPSQALAAGTVGRLAERLRGRSAARRGPSVRISDGPGRPIIVVHGLRIQPQAYVGLAKLFAGRPVDVLVDPHWGRTEGFFHSIEECASAYAEEIRRIQPQGPYDLVGDCYGGAVAFEVAHLLERGGAKTRLAMLETPGLGRRARLRHRAAELPRKLAETGLRAALRWPRLADLLRGRLRFSNPATALDVIVAIDPDDRSREAALGILLPALSHVDVSTPPAHEAWERITRAVLSAGGTGNSERGFTSGAMWRHGLRVDLENRRNLERFHPRAERVSPTLLVSDVGTAHDHATWGRVCRNCEYLTVPLVATRGTPHDEFLSARNLALFGPRLRAWFDAAESRHESGWSAKHMP